MQIMGQTADDYINAARRLLDEASHLDSEGRFAEAITKYGEGMERLEHSCSFMSDVDPFKRTLRAKIDECAERVRKIQQAIRKQEEERKKQPEMYKVKEYEIEAFSTGHGYDTVFGMCIDHTLTAVRVQEPYCLTEDQCVNFVRFCEMVVGRARNLRSIELLTKRLTADNTVAFEGLSHSLQSRRIAFSVNTDEHLHDRAVRFDNGWVVKIGRGLHYFKPVRHSQMRNRATYMLGAWDLNLRQCEKTTVDVSRRSK